MSRYLYLSPALGALLLAGVGRAPAAPTEPEFPRQVQAVFSRLGCNGGACHGAVKGQNGFQLSLFGADPALDRERLLRDGGGRRLDFHSPEASLLLRKASGQTAHKGGRRTEVGSPEYEVLRRWIASGGKLGFVEGSRVTKLLVRPALHTLRPGEKYRLRVEATFADGSAEDVTGLCSYRSLDAGVATVSSDGTVTARGVGGAALLARFRADPALAQVVVPLASADAFPDVTAHNFIDEHVLARLRKLGVPPAGLADDATFLRRASLDICGELPAPKEIRAFLADRSADKRAKKIDELLRRPGHAALWTMKLCDILKASDFGVYADGVREEADAPRFQAWVRARLEENLPYDQFVERILTATSRDGRDLESWAKEVVEMEEGYGPGRKDLELYKKRRTLDLYWQRSSSAGVPAALQVAHAFLGLRLECAQCHRHPHDVWQQDDLLSFANFFMPVRKIGFQGDNEKKFPEVAVVFKRMNAEAKTLADEAKKLRGGDYKKLEASARTAKMESNRIGNELKRAAPEKLAALRVALKTHQDVLAKFEQLQQRLMPMERRSKLLPEAARRVMHAEVRDLGPGKAFASVTSPIGTQSSKRYRLLGQSEDVVLTPGQAPRQMVMDWMRRPDNPYFARAIVNRVWAHYLGRGIVHPPDDLSPFNPPSHPELLQELADGLVKNKYDLRWLHSTILNSRTYQQSSRSSKRNEADLANYAYFYYRRLPAEVLLDALNQTTGVGEDMGMGYHHWPKGMKTVEIPFAPRNAFVTFMLSSFGKPKRNAAVQCDCERDGDASVLQVLSLANHPRLAAKIADDKGTASRVLKEIANDRERVEELFLVALGRLPADAERAACARYLAGAPSAAKGLQGILWGLLNTREFILQH